MKRSKLGFFVLPSLKANKEPYRLLQPLFRIESDLGLSFALSLAAILSLEIRSPQAGTEYLGLHIFVCPQSEPGLSRLCRSSSSPPVSSSRWMTFPMAIDLPMSLTEVRSLDYILSLRRNRQPRALKSYAMLPNIEVIARAILLVKSDMSGAASSSVANSSPPSVPINQIGDTRHNSGPRQIECAIRVAVITSKNAAVPNTQPGPISASKSLTTDPSAIEKPSRFAFIVMAASFAD
ncbi:MAG: hypothetical protein Q9169_003334 [Polycauliona sp. 2 TL-2023]